MVVANVPIEYLDLQLRTDRSHDLAEPKTVSRVFTTWTTAVSRSPDLRSIDLGRG